MIVDNNEEITTGNDGTEMCSSGADVAVEMCSPESHDTCGDCGAFITIIVKAEHTQMKICTGDCSAFSVVRLFMLIIFLRRHSDHCL